MHYHRSEDVAWILKDLLLLSNGPIHEPQVFRKMLLHQDGYGRSRLCHEGHDVLKNKMDFLFAVFIDQASEFNIDLQLEKPFALDSIVLYLMKLVGNSLQDLQDNGSKERLQETDDKDIRRGLEIEETQKWIS